ncbi:MAG TPA: penicillin-binding transpeptidase domain-containing protein [Acidimicrobiales bacterium]|nr:penicillin-binding transpeptidase domain-containing protein [Acidimicrobiales bacterium]
MSKQIRNLGVFLAICYVALFVQVNRLTVTEAESLRDKPANTRAVERDFSSPRGDIVSADGVVLAESVPSDDRFELQRIYPTGDLFAHVTGYFAFGLGSTGVEREYNGYLNGDDIGFDLDRIDDFFVERDVVGDVILSVRTDVQQVAREQLGDRPGSVVALDPRNGEVIAMWSTATFDPNVLASHDFDAAAAASQALNDDPARPTRSRVYQERYFPGSTFKVVTATGGIERDGVTPDQPEYPVTDSYQPPGGGRPIPNFGGASCGGTLFVILQNSCNTSFAQMGVEMGGDNLYATARGFGFDTDVPFDLPRGVQSNFPEQIVNDPPLVAQASIGQNDVQATPLQMALVAAGVANGGVVMEPHVMREVRDDQGNEVASFDDGEFTQPMSPETAGTLRQAMISVVTDGSARRLDEGLEDFEVGGKTGTAQLGTDPPQSHAWIIGFAGPPDEAPHIAVAVIVEAQPGASEQTGGQVAAPIAAAVMQRALAPPAEADQGEQDSQQDGGSGDGG